MDVQTGGPCGQEVGKGDPAAVRKAETVSEKQIDIFPESSQNKFEGMRRLDRGEVMARHKRVAYRKRYQNRFSMFLVTLVVVLILILVQMGSLELKRKINTKAAEEAALQAQIEAEIERGEEIEKFGKEVQTKGYIENVAREKLGLVYEDEILFKQKD